MTNPASTQRATSHDDTTRSPTGAGAPTGAPSPPTSRPTDDVPRSVGRVLDLLEIVLGEGNCKLTSASSRADLTPTTALRYLRALEVRGYVVRDDAGDFSAGPVIVRLAAALRGVASIDQLAETAQPHLDRLAERTGESAYLAVGDGRTATYLATAESPRAIRHVGWVGQSVDLERSALGAALARPGVVATRTGAVEPDITAMSRALPSLRGLGIAVSVVGPEYRFTDEARRAHEVALDAAVDALASDLRTPGEDEPS